jgi:hypothetical protein
MKKLRKFFVVSVMVLSVIAMSGLTAPTASAAASAGDLIKMEGLSSVYYLGDDGKRYVFPNESTYFSWFADFSSVVTISATELQSYPLGGNVVMRPGTTLVKITTDPSVYAVEPNGVLRKIQSEAQATALYGTNWNKRIVDLADSFFTNYTIGAPLADGQIPAGSLVKNAGSATVYYYDGTNYRAIASEAAMAANRLWMKYVMTVTNTLTAGGSSLTGMEAPLVRVNQGASTGPVVTGSGLMVSLNSQTPMAMSVPQNGARVPMAKVNLTAANDGAVSVNSITVKRIGLSSYTNIDKVWAEKDGMAVASKKSMNSNDESILTFSPALIVNAGQTVTLDLIASLTGSGAGNIGLSIASASAVSATAASVTGSFPVNGNLMSPTSYTVVNLAVYDAYTTTSTVKVGDEKVELGHFTVGFNGTAKDAVLSSITLKNNGVEDLASAAMNMYLEYAGEKVTLNTVVDGRYVTFYFPANYTLLKDDASKIFYIKGDVIAKENTATNSFQFLLNKSTDFVAYEKATGFGANVYSSTGGTTLADAVAISNITIDAGTITVSKKSASPADTTIVKGTDFTALLVNVRTDEAINVDGLNLTYGSGNGTATATDQFENVRVYVNNVLLDSFDPVSTTTAAVAIDSTVTFNKGDNEVKIMARAKTTAVASSDIKFTLNNGIFTSMNPEYVISGNAVASGSISGSAIGGIFTVEGASLTTVRNDGYSAGKTIVKGSPDVSLGKFTLKASNDTVKVTSISLGANSTASTSTTTASSIYDMKLYVDGTQVGSTVDFGSTGASFSSLNFNIAKDATVNVEVKGSFDTSAAGGFATLMTVNSQDSRGTAISTGNTASTVDFNVVESGTLVVALGGDTPVAGLLAANNSTEQEVAHFKFTAVNDSANLTEINVVNYISGTTTSQADPRIAAVRLYDGTTLVDSFVPVNGAGRFTINNSVIISANANKTLSIRVVLNGIENDADATNKLLAIRVTDVKSKSSAGTETTTSANLTGNEFMIRKTTPTIAKLALSDTLLSAGDKAIAKFTVAASAAGDVTVGRFALTITNTTSATIATTSNPLKINGSTKGAVASIADGKMIILLDTPEVVAAGTSKTFEVIATVGVSGTGSESITAKLVEDAAYDADATVAGVTGDFVWSDGASIITPTYNSGKRVLGLSTETWSLSK